MDPTQADDRPAATEADPNALLRIRIALADAAFVAEGVTLGLLVKWAERARAVRRPVAAVAVDRAMKASATAAASRTGRCHTRATALAPAPSLRWCPGRHSGPSTAAAARKVRSEQGSGGRVGALSAATWQALGCPR
jgi:hypothetical protein